jgi:predicted Zn finger-like uncharacterized protein
MIIVCQNCSTRFQVDDEKVAARTNAVCPECQKKLTTSSPAVEKSALSLGRSPSTEGRRFDRNAAPKYNANLNDTGKPSAKTEAEKFVQMLMSALGPASGKGIDGTADVWKSRKALVCASEEHREKVARTLSQEGYEVFVALDTRQAVERMRENKLSVVLLDPQFDSAEQGAAFVVREVNVMRPSQRRRLFFVLMSPTLRTLDAHGAFLNNVNAIVNLKDTDELIRILDQGLREYNDLYHDFNQALKQAAI